MDIVEYLFPEQCVLFILGRGPIEGVPREAGDLGRGEPELVIDREEQGCTARHCAVALDRGALGGELAADEPDPSLLVDGAIAGGVEQRVLGPFRLHCPARPRLDPGRIALAIGVRAWRCDAEAFPAGRGSLVGYDLAPLHLPG